MKKKTAIYEKLVHPFAPVYNSNSRLLILGSFPSPMSRKNGFYYGNKQNRFWLVLSQVFSEPLPLTINEKCSLILKHGIALWDVLSCCEISGADDCSIRNVQVNDLSPIIKLGIKRIYTTGKKAEVLYKRHILKNTGIKASYLPSTSPANRGRWPLEKLIEAYSILAK